LAFGLKVVLLTFPIITSGLTFSGFSGEWIFEARTNEGSLRAKLALKEDGKKLDATLWIDNHVLKGSTASDGDRFEILLVHADGSGPAHSERLRLIGKIERGELSGSWENGEDRGSWTARKQ